jgi:cob(I)alamin adenosyltransferase
MANRLTDLVTRTGDDGSTGLADGSRLPKDAPRIEAIGAVDELNSVVGCVLAEALPAPVEEVLREVQQHLFDLGAELAVPGTTRLDEALVADVETTIVEWNRIVGPLAEFILPGGGRGASMAQLARAVCRRTERRLVALSRIEPVSPVALRFLNRLSDLLFVAARVTARHHGEDETFWRR